MQMRLWKQLHRGSEKGAEWHELASVFQRIFSPGDVPPLSSEFTRKTGEDRQRLK